MQERAGFAAVYRQKSELRAQTEELEALEASQQKDEEIASDEGLQRESDVAAGPVETETEVEKPKTKRRSSQKKKLGLDDIHFVQSTGGFGMSTVSPSESKRKGGTTAWQPEHTHTPDPASPRAH